MAFLDNSGDIILDAVLTDTGRMRMAKGDGSFKITKFALGDDEINYKLFDGTATTGEQDLQIMSTPILEAFSNNTSGMKSKLISLANNPGLYMPVIRENNKVDATTGPTSNDYNTWLCAVDAETQGYTSSGGDTTGDLVKALGDYSAGDFFKVGVLTGFQGAGPYIMVDQGIDSGEDGPSAVSAISAELYESQYLIEMDSRLCSLISSDASTTAAVSFIDDDQIASYYLSQAVNTTFVETNPGAGKPEASQQVIGGPRGSRLMFAIRASLNLQTSVALFTRLGSTFTTPGSPNPAQTYFYIDSNIRVTGVTTGSRVDIPIRFCKWKETA